LVVKELAMETRALPFAIATLVCLLVAQAGSTPLQHDPEQSTSRASDAAPASGAAGGVAYYNDGFDARRSTPGPTDPHGPTG
jgi:hypothetical protein